MMERTCEHRGCNSPDRNHAEPQFTKALSSIKKGEHQPEWFCDRHSRLHPKTTFWGEVIRPARKEVKRGAS